jgi:hypothetical protein
MKGVRYDRIDMVGRVPCVTSKKAWKEQDVKKSTGKHILRISPGTGKTRSPIVHSPLVPAFPPIGGRPPTSTILNTSTSSETRPLRARAIVSARAFSWVTSRVMRGSRGAGGRSLAWERVRRRVARFSRKARRRCLATGR